MVKQEEKREAKRDGQALPKDTVENGVKLSPNAYLDCDLAAIRAKIVQFRQIVKKV